MARIKKSTTLYSHPFCKGYWLDAAKEFADLRMLVIAALVIALRVALKMVRIPLAPNLDITPAFLANAMGAMIYGPVVGTLGAIVSDVLGVLLRGDTYFLPYVLTEICGTVIFAMFFYRQRVTTGRVILSRFSICLLVNILLTIPIDNWYQQFMYGYHNTVLTLPRILKNLFMFPIESVALTLFLNAIQPVTYRMKLTFTPPEKLKLSIKQIVLLVILAVVGAASVFGYLFYHYDNTSLSAAYTTQERIEANKSMVAIVQDESDTWDDEKTVTIVESAYKEFLGDEITYTVAVYAVDDAQLQQNIADALAEDPTSTYGEDTLWTYSKSKAAKDDALVRQATVTVVVHEETGEILSFSAKTEE